jgi:hypothetical protein
MNLFKQIFTPDELAVFSTLDTPVKIQAYLDGIPYSEEEAYRCPRQVLSDHKAHCFDGALFAAAALRHIGYPPLVLDMLPVPDRDDDHMLALFKIEGYWGAIAKSNFVGLRYREPIYRTLRELVMTFFEQFYNTDGEKTLRSYTRPLNLQVYDRFNWMVSDASMMDIAHRLLEMHRYALLTPSMEAGLTPVDERFYQAGLSGANWEGLYKLPPPSNKKG